MSYLMPEPGFDLTVHPEETPAFVGRCLLEPLDCGRHWRLFHPFKYISRFKLELVVPGAFVTDLASVPRVLWNLLPPFGKYCKAAVLHDWLYQLHWIGIEEITKSMADDLFYEAMVVCKVPDHDREVIYQAVRVAGKSSWDSGPRRREILNPTGMEGAVHVCEFS